MTEYSSNFYHEPNTLLIEKFEEMLKSRNSYFFDVDEVETLADYYLERGNYRKARKAVNYGLELFSRSPGIMLRQAQTFMMGNKPEKALEILDFLEAAEPSNTDMLLFKAVVHRNLSDFEGTKKCLMKALNVSVDNKEEIYLDLAFEQELVDDYSGAIESLKASLAINPGHEPSLFELAYCFEMADELEKGIEYFQEYLDDSPYSFVGWYNLALCFEKLSLFEKAIEAVEYCLAIKDDFVNAHILRANLYTSCENDIKAIEAYTESLEYDSSNPMVYAAIGECFERIEYWELAERNYSEALRLDPKYVDALMGLGAVKEQEKKYTESGRLYREALMQDETNIDNWHIYVELLVNSGRMEEAEEAYERMIETFVDDEEAWISLADLRAKRYSYGEAVTTLEKAQAAIGEGVDLVWHRAKHLILAGRSEEGGELLARALAENAKGCKYFLDIFPESVLFPNIAALIELYTQAQRKDEL